MATNIWKSLSGKLRGDDGAGTNDGTIGAITADASVIAAIQELAAQINKLVADDLDNRQSINALIDDLQALGFAT